MLKEFKRIPPTLLRGTAVALMRAHSCRYRPENVRHIFQITGYLSHVPFNKFGGVFYKTRDRSGLMVFTDADVFYTDWYAAHKSLILQSWHNLDALQPVLDEFEITHFIGMPDAEQRIITRAEDVKLWAHIREAYASGVTMQRIAEQVCLPIPKVRGVVKKYIKEDLTTAEQ